jgi:enterochelin esterase-like enzyme
VAVLALGLGAVVVIASVRSRPAPSSPPRTLQVTCSSPALGGKLPAIVYLPKGYPSGSARYRVIYFLHGLPAGPSFYKSNAFVAEALATDRLSAIVVAPQGARDPDSDREYLDWGPAEDWPQAIASDLTHCIDSRLRTIPNRSGRALVGLSAGGFGAFNIGLRNLATFGAVESWSGYFAATDPSGLHVLDFGSPPANRQARVPPGRHLATKLALAPTFIAFYVGRQDSRFLSANVELDQDLTQHHIPHLFRTFPGGHSGTLWRSQAGPWLGFALAALARTRAKPSAHSAWYSPLPMG